MPLFPFPLYCLHWISDMRVNGGQQAPTGSMLHTGIWAQHAFGPGRWGAERSRLAIWRWTYGWCGIHSHNWLVGGSEIEEAWLFLIKKKKRKKKKAVVKASKHAREREKSDKRLDQWGKKAKSVWHRQVPHLEACTPSLPLPLPQLGWGEPHHHVFPRKTDTGQVSSTRLKRTQQLCVASPKPWTWHTWSLL